MLIASGVHVGNSSNNLLNSSHTSPKPNAQGDASNTATDSPSKTSEPYFIVPPGFRTNTFFVGMEKEYQELDRRLFDKRRRVGTAAVLLHGQAGGGKSHLARQYVNKNRKRFEGGVFWITSKLREERYQGYSTIYQKVIAREAPDMCRADRPFVETVKAWFEGRKDWLLVFDGITLDQDEDATELQSFIPDSKDSSIIYISRAKNLESKQRLLRPVPIRVGPLKEDDARKLLFKSLDEFKRRRPTDADVKRATELTKKIGGLPLAIDAISHRIADTHEPLAKFNIKSYSADPKMAGTYNTILEDLQRLGHVEAWNLIHVICFFGQHIPVEFVNLGLKSLSHDGVSVKTLNSQQEGGGKPDLNTTFSILMRYALIERNEPDDSSSGSQSSSRDSLTSPEPIDVLKVHSVVQRFCCDSLNAKKMLPQWIGYAVRLFAYSYHQAHARITQKPAPGRVSDYREYLTHGRRLWDHANEYESKKQSLEDIRKYLEPVIISIRQEIQHREPDSSSQESLTERVQQISIFDRTSSTSSSAPSGSEVRTPHRPSPLPLPSADENTFGFPLHKPSVDSPRSMGTLTPKSGIPKIVGETPRFRFPGFTEDDGYDTDGEDQQLHSSSVMQRERSDRTARPRGNTAGSHNSGWEIVPSSRRSRKSQRRRDLGTFRPRALPAKAEVNRRHVTGATSRPPTSRNKERRLSSGAAEALSEVQNRGPPNSESRRGSFWRLASPTRIVNALSGQPTYASVAGRESRATQTPAPAPQRTSPHQSSDYASIDARPSSVERNHPSNIGPSPLAAEFIPQNHSQDRYPPHQSTNGNLYRPVPYPNGPNPDNLPLVENVNTSYKRPRPTDSGPESQPRIFSPATPPTGPQTPYPLSRQQFSPSMLPAGYYSQPMSRNVSDRSHFSLAETEPPQYHPAFAPSPQLGNVMLPDEALSPSRERLADGRPMRKSPKTVNYALPVETTIQGTSAWTPIPTTSSSSTRQTPPPPTYNPAMYPPANMSRSSSGPGVAIDHPSQGLGIIPFGPPALSSSVESASSQVQFGEHAPISLEEARRRAFEHEALLKEREREIRELRQRAEDVEFERERMRALRGMEGDHVDRRGRTPYPAVDMMPEEGGTREAEGNGGQRWS